MTRRAVSWATVLLAILLATASPASGSARQGEGAATSAAGAESGPAEAAIFYSQLEAAGDFSGLYQWMHPDARQVI
uniref:hypothetical protein n=1 Tax=Salmonella enterica TaxID=28901 RepID=UPI003299A459